MLRAPEDEDEFLQADDVRLELPEAVTHRDADPSQIHGDLHDAVLKVTADVNGWITQLVETSGRVVEFLDGVPETSREGTARIYGPYADRDGRDLSWLVRLDETEKGSTFALFVGLRTAKAQAEMEPLMSGSLVVGEDARSGGADGYLTWRQISGAYLVEVPDYDMGDAKTCALGVEALGK